MSYCEFTKDLEETHLHRIYHDNFYGFPLEDDNELFGRLILEINQAGLNWLTILKKEKNFREAFDDFNIKKIAGYDDKKIEILMNNSGIIRNKKKIEAVIYNANRVLELQNEFGSFKGWLEHFSPKDKEEWTSIFRKNFKFTGGLIVEEFLMSTGYIKGAHNTNCQTLIKVINSNPQWKRH